MRRALPIGEEIAKWQELAQLRQRMLHTSVVAQSGDLKRLARLSKELGLAPLRSGDRHRN